MPLQHPELEPTASRPQAGALVSEKRKDPRYPTNDAAEVRILPEGSTLPATVVNVSKSGLRLEMAKSLPSNARIEIVMPSSKLAVFGEVRYCRHSGAAFHAGILINDVVYPKRNNAQHVHDDEIALYVVGRGLTAAEVLRIGDHLSACDRCTRVMAQIAAPLYRPIRRLAPRDEIAP